MSSKMTPTPTTRVVAMWKTRTRMAPMLSQSIHLRRRGRMAMGATHQFAQLTHSLHVCRHTRFTSPLLTTFASYRHRGDHSHSRWFPPQFRCRRSRQCVLPSCTETESGKARTTDPRTSPTSRYRIQTRLPPSSLHSKSFACSFSVVNIHQVVILHFILSSLVALCSCHVDIDAHLHPGSTASSDLRTACHGQLHAA